MILSRGVGALPGPIRQVTVARWVTHNRKKALSDGKLIRIHHLFDDDLYKLPGLVVRLPAFCVIFQA